MLPRTVSPRTLFLCCYVAALLHFGCGSSFRQSTSTFSIDSLQVKGLDVYQNLLYSLGQPLPVDNIKFVETETTGIYLLVWKESTQSGFDHYEVQLLSEEDNMNRTIRTTYNQYPISNVQGAYTAKVRACSVCSCGVWASETYSFDNPTYHSLHFDSAAVLVTDAGFPFSDAMTFDFILKAPAAAANCSTTACYPTIINYASANPNEFNIFLVSMTREIGFALQSVSTMTDYTLPVNEWVHLTVVLNNVDRAGHVLLFVNGLHRFTATFSPTRSVVSGGILALGNDQDVLGGKFEVMNQFYGFLDEVRVWGTALTAAQVYQLPGRRFTAAAQPSILLTATTKDLLAQWSFTGTTLAALGSSYPHNTYPLKREWFAAGTQRIDDIGHSLEAWLMANRALRFEKTEDVVEGAFSFPSTSLTVAFWVKIEKTVSASLCVMSYASPSSFNAFGVWLNPLGRVSILLNELSMDSTITVPLNTWTHLAYTQHKNVFGTTEAAIYVNGVLDSSSVVDILPIPSEGAFALGQDYDCAPADGGCFSAEQSLGQVRGSLDNIRIHNRALTPAEIRQEMATCGVWATGEDPSLVLHLAGDTYAELEEGGAVFLADISGNGNHAAVARAEMFVFDDEVPTGPCRATAF